MHGAVTCMQPIYGIECMRGEGACVSNMQVVTVFYDQENLGVGAKTADMITKKMNIAKSCSCRLTVGSKFCFGVSNKFDFTCIRRN